MTPIRVAIVDDQALFRAGLAMLIRSQPDLALAGEAADGHEAVALNATAHPDVILMDVRMPGLDGIEATRAIVGNPADGQDARARPRIIVLTTFEQDEAAVCAIRAGASGFLLKDADPEFLLAAIRAVHAGTQVVAASATLELLAAHSARTSPAPHSFDTLTEREREIFAHAVRGLSNTEIARLEFVSEATVKTHISRILTKLSLRDRVQLVVFAYEHGLA